jgi:hypothetical protein
MTTKDEDDWGTPLIPPLAFERLFGAIAPRVKVIFETLEAF